MILRTDPVSLIPPLGPLAARSRASGRAFLLAVPLCLCAAVPALSQCPDGTPPPCAVRPYHQPAPAANSVAVMYLDNESRDTSDAYLADGLTEEITTKLGQVGRLAVTSNTTMRRYRGANALEPTALGRSLRVAQLVSGSIRRAGHRIRINVELLRARDGVQLWADAYDQSDADLLAIEEDIARRVATAIAGRLLPDEQAALATRPTQNPEAYDHFLRGNFLMAQRSPAPARRAVAEYQDAIVQDLGFARAYGRLGLAYALFVDWGWPFPGLSYDSLLARAGAAADHAVELDSASADAWLARAYVLAYQHPRDFAGAVPAFERAIRLDPGNAEAHHQYGSILMCLGRDSLSVAEFRRAIALDPGRGISLDNLADLLNMEHRPDEALRVADSGIAANADAYYLYADRANIRLEQGDVGGARQDVASALRTSPPDYQDLSQALAAALDASAGDSAGGRARLQRVVSRQADPARPNYSLALWIALAYVRLNDRGHALTTLESVQPRGLNLWYIMRDPGFDPIRQDPRFRALDEEIRPQPSR